MAAMYDVLCSLVISGVVLLMIVTFNGTIVEHAGAQTVRVTAQTNLTTVCDIIAFEIRKMGYNVSLGTDSAIVYADSVRITFKGATTYGGPVDVITYAFDSTSTPNANKKTHILQRIFNGKTQLINVGITQFRLAYFDSAGNPLTSYPIANVRSIKSIKLAVNLESTTPYITSDERYLKLNPGAYWERTIKPPNLN